MVYYKSCRETGQKNTEKRRKKCVGRDKKGLDKWEEAWYYESPARAESVPCKLNNVSEQNTRKGTSSSLKDGLIDFFE